MRRLAILFGGFGLWLLFLIPAIPAFAQADVQAGLCAGAELRFTDNPRGECDDSGAVNRINDIVHTIINLISAVVAIVAVVMIIVGGLRYITSGGNDTSVTSAKNTILYAIIGLIIVAMAQILVRFTLGKIANS
jgi:hypothetical protein